MGLSRDTRYIAADVTQTSRGYAVVLLDREAGTPQVISNGTISPDSKWIAYASDRTDRSEIWVTSIDNPGRPRQITFDRGDYPLWSPLGDESFLPPRHRDPGPARNHRAFVRPDRRFQIGR